MKTVITALFLTFSLTTMANSETPVNEVQLQQPAVAKVFQSEVDIPVNLDAPKKDVANSGSVFKYTLAFAILGAMGCVSYFLIRKYKYQNPHAAKTQIKVLTQHYLGPKKSLAIIRVAGESVLIGITDQNINLIKSLALLDEDIPEENSEDLPKKFDSVFNQKAAQSEFSDEPQDEFSFSGIRETVTGKLKNMRNWS